MSWALAVNLLFLATSAQATPCRHALRPQDEMWVVSDRGVPCADQDQVPRLLRYWRWDTGCGWRESDWETFTQPADPQSVTCVFVSGNGYSAAEQRDLAWLAYRGLVSEASTGRAVRFVAWSWHSDKLDAGPIQDARVKSARSTLSAWRLASWVAELPPETQVNYVGTSFGARTVMGALHLQGGGSLAGRRLTVTQPARPSADVVLISAAIDSDSFHPGNPLDCALSPVGRLLLVNNGTDKMLKHYHLLYGWRCHNAALGYAGLACQACLGPDAAKVQTIDASRLIGPKHGCKPYFRSTGLCAHMRHCVIEGNAR